MEAKLRSRLVLACALVATLLCFLTGRLVWIEEMNGERLAERARAHYEDEVILPAQRGRIYDRNGELLARNQTVFRLKVDCRHIRDTGLASIGLARKEGEEATSMKRRYLPAEIQSRYREYIVETLAPVLRIPQHQLGRTINSKERGEIILAKNLEDDFARQLENLLDEKAIAGIYLEEDQRRTYPSPQSLTHVIGHVDAEGVGRAGIEAVYDERMQGHPGFRRIERDRRRREIHAYRGDQRAPVPGDDVHLTVDMGLQSLLEQELDAAVEEHTPGMISSVWMRPSTGEVLAMASRPHFDLESRKGIRRNIAVADFYEPGSTFKLVGYAAAFDRKQVTPSTPVDCHFGQYQLEGYTLKDHHPYGTLTAEVAFAKSSNIGAFKVVRPLGEHVFHHYMERFGFGSRTGIQLPGENPGRVSPVEKWTRTSFSSKVMGYEVAVTPLQMVAAVSVIANGGEMRQPTIVRGFQGHRQRKMVPEEAAAVRRVVSARAAENVRRCMLAVTREGGTGTRGAIPGYSVAGKTGTARKHVPGKGYVHGRYTVSFVGFFPAEKPELVGVVVVDDPQTTGIARYGGTIAAPIFKSIAEKAIRFYGIAPDRPEELEELERNGLELSWATGAGGGRGEPVEQP